MLDDDLRAYFHGVGLFMATFTVVTLPFVLWAMVRFRRAGPAVEDAPVAVGGGAYRDGTVRPLSARGLPWSVYAALLAAGIGGAFAITSAVLGISSPAGIAAYLPLDAFHAAGVIGCHCARLALLVTAIAVLRRWKSTSAWLRASAALTVVSGAVYADWVRELDPIFWRRLAYIDGALYLGGLLLTLALVALANRAMRRLFRAHPQG